MSEPAPYSLPRYLSAKRSVDDRAINQRVWADFVKALGRRQPDSGTLSILEIGGGIGSTLIRLLEPLSKTDLTPVHYTLVDIEPSVLDVARTQLPKWGKELGFEVRSSGNQMVFTGRGRAMTVEFLCEDAFRVFGNNGASYHAVIAQAWLDLVNLNAALKGIFRCLVPEGLFYAPIHFDGHTSFSPGTDESFTQKVVRLYHESMDRKQTPHGPAGGSHTGRQLLTTIPDLGGQIEAVGASDWIVYPRPDGYPDDEAYFLHHVVHFVENELSDHPDLDEEHFQRWIRERRHQINEGELIYVAHQLDLLVEGPDENAHPSKSGASST